ncbi:TPA: hypothetical protein ACOENU_000263 [Stenotrophomonas maltophilia]
MNNKPQLFVIYLTLAVTAAVMYFVGSIKVDRTLERQGEKYDSMGRHLDKIADHLDKIADHLDKAAAQLADTSESE